VCCTCVLPTVADVIAWSAAGEQAIQSRTPKDPLQELTDAERKHLVKVSRSASERAEHVRRAKALLAVAGGASHMDAARSAGIGARKTVSALVSRFNECGLEALDSRHGGGPAKRYGDAEKARILLELARTPELEKDGTATWSISLLQRALRSAEDGFPEVSTYTIFQTLRGAGYSWQRTRTWCSTGIVKRKRKEGIVTVTDPQTEEKRGNRACIHIR
jgi:transposase